MWCAPQPCPGARASRRRLVATMLALAATLPLTPQALVSAPAAPTEYEVKAVFLYNFSQFVEWPEASLAGTTSPFVIGIVGEDPFGPHLDEAVKGETVLGHPLVVQRYASVADVGTAHILFIGNTASGQLADLLVALEGRATLLVTDIDRAAERGAIIQFANEQNRLRLRINVAAAKAAGLTISSKLLRPATIIATERG